MRRRQYLTRIGASASVAMVAGCGSPGQEAGTETGQGGDGTQTANGGEGDTGTTTGGGETGTGTGTSAGGQTTTIEMISDGSDYLFDPVGLYVEPGATITWVNESGSHSSTAYTVNNPQSEVDRIPDDAEGWNSETISEEGAEFSHTFDVEGTYDYYCIPHKTLGMVGRLVVGEPSGFEDDPPDGPVPDEQTIVDEGVVTQENFDA